VLYSRFSSRYPHYKGASRVIVELIPRLLKKLMYKRFLCVTPRQTQYRFNNLISYLGKLKTNADMGLNSMRARVPILTVN
jgi:hypothetical protein